MEEIKSGVYRHYKGEHYLVLGLGRHTETEELFVVNIPLYLREGPRIALRPLTEFTGTVEHNGETVPRYTYIGQVIDKDYLR